jgi:uncharacterized protein (TIGR03435 family)
MAPPSNFAPQTEQTTDIPSLETAPGAVAVATATPATRGFHLPALPTLLLGGWIVGSAGFLLPVVIGLLQVRALRRSALPWRQAQSLVSRLALELDVRQRVDLLRHEAVAGPMTSGLFGPTVVVPMDADEWPLEDLERAIVHELEHVRRRDWLSQCLARVICAGYWFHPLVWIARQQLALEAERACDDVVLQRAEATRYADQLVELAKRLSTAHHQPLLAMAARRDLATRVRALLDRRQARGRAGVTVVTLASLAAVALVITMSPWRVVAAQQSPTSPQTQQAPSSSQAQTAPAAAKFDVVSVRPCDPKANQIAGGRGGWAGTSSPGRLHLDCQSMVMLIHMAYVTFGDDRFNAPNTMPEDRLIPLPDWAHSERFTIEGKADGEPSGIVMRGSMLRAVLEDRFKLKMHRETRVVPTEELVVAKGGPKLTPLKPGACVPYDWSTFPQKALEPGQARCMTSTEMDSANNWVRTSEGESLDQMAANLTNTERQVVNKTGIQGFFTFRIVFQGSQSGGAPPFKTALRDQLGLELRPAKGTREFFVLDHVERPAPDGPSPTTAAPPRATGSVR